MPSEDDIMRIAEKVYNNPQRNELEKKMMARCDELVNKLKTIQNEHLLEVEPDIQPIAPPIDLDQIFANILKIDKT